LYTDYKDWMKEEHGDDKPLTQRRFGEFLNEKQIPVTGRVPGNGQKKRGPIRLKKSWEREGADVPSDAGDPFEHPDHVAATPGPDPEDPRFSEFDEKAFT
jgi:hypothetical protein